MKTTFIALITLVSLLGLSATAGAFYTPPVGNVTDKNNPDLGINDYSYRTIVDMIGDNDGYGYGATVVPDGIDLPYTDNPVEGAGWLFDNRSADELAAVNGAQATDVEDMTGVTFHHTFDMSLFKSLCSATFTIDISGVQQGIFGGYSHLYLDGVEMTDFLSLDQYAWGSNVLTYNVDLAMLSDGALDVTFDKWADDHVAVDFTALTVAGEGACPVPEPATMFLMGLGLAGAGVIRRLRK